ncbi:hypothetical protein ACFSNA_10735 [Pedobacter mendelii]|uniref:Unsaturated rhamnogalacturonyl hydrolase n=2 Tax=Pedobacter mendelii TaxID=1908240 RepID=A0ABQ2BJ64_9SPHI|nr:hypothetical protein GCM10008119_18080 [Pedobacter mendelii]
MNFFLFSVILIAPFFTKAQTVTVDGYFNQESKKDKSGNLVRFHYTWDDIESSGFSKFGEAFKVNGAKNLKRLDEAPTAINLKETNVYIIVDPDNLKDNPKPNYINDNDAKEIANWVYKGGVLFIMANDSANTDLHHLNILGSKFGFKFNRDITLHVVDDEHFANGGLSTASAKFLFKTSKKVFLKDACSISIEKPGKAILKDKNGANVLVSSKYGKGIVLAVGDPWLYNEYVNGRLPKEYENDKAMNDIAAWLIAKTKKK